MWIVTIEVLQRVHVGHKTILSHFNIVLLEDRAQLVLGVGHVDRGARVVVEWTHVRYAMPINTLTHVRV